MSGFGLKSWVLDDGNAALMESICSDGTASSFVSLVGKKSFNTLTSISVLEFNLPKTTDVSSGLSFNLKFYPSLSFLDVQHAQTSIRSQTWILVSGFKCVCFILPVWVANWVIIIVKNDAFVLFCILAKAQIRPANTVLFEINGPIELTVYYVTMSLLFTV